MSKRKTTSEDQEQPQQPRRSSRRVPTTNDVTTKDAVKPVPLDVELPRRRPKKRKAEKEDLEAEGEDETRGGDVEEASISNKPAPKAKSRAKPAPKAPTAQPSTTKAETDGTHQFWLMKAEPESRLEKGHDVKFSIDDLRAKSEPEPWDGIRNYQARNNLRAMKKGDLAFFYHSSCKVPGIVGIMEIVSEHEPDLSAHDASLPYYDASSTSDNPKWSIVRVTFRHKLQTPITLAELKELRERPASPLQHMQVLSRARLSVSRVEPAEWAYLTDLMRENGDAVGG